jgi:hypothetical protein
MTLKELWESTSSVYNPWRHIYEKHTPSFKIEWNGFIFHEPKILRHESGTFILKVHVRDGRTALVRLSPDHPVLPYNFNFFDTEPIVHEEYFHRLGILKKEESPKFEYQELTLCLL